MNKKFKVQPLKGVEIHNAKSVGTRTVNLLMGEHEGEYVRGDIMDANAVAQAIDEVRGGIDGSHDSLAKLNEEVKTNATVINGTITYANKIADNLQKESETRTSEDDKLNTAISNEATARTNAVKAVDDKLTAEVTARTNADKDINKKIDVINGDSKTDGSIKKAIADVIDAAPEAYDTLKEIADKLKDNDDLHAVIQEAITDKASNEALTNEVNRATAKEEEIAQSVSDLDAIAVKGDGQFVGLRVDNSDDKAVDIITSRGAFGLNVYSYDGDQRRKCVKLTDDRIMFMDYSDDQLYGNPGIIISDSSVYKGDQQVVFEPTNSPIIVDNKIADSYIPTTVALKTDLSEYIKTKDADSKYLSSNRYTVSTDGCQTQYIGWFKATNLSSTQNSNFASISKSNGSYLMAYDSSDRSDTKVYNTNGGLADLNNYAKLTDGNVNSLIKPADITSVNGETSISSTQYVTANTVTISELAKAYNKLVTYVRHLDSSLKDANLLTESVISE